MQLSLITDEISQDPTEAAQFAADNGLQYVAVRSAWGRNIIDLTDGEVSDLSAIFQLHGLKVSAVMSPLLKCWPLGAPIPTNDLVDPHFVGFSRNLVDHLDHGMRLPMIAGQLGAPIVRIFTFLACQSGAQLGSEDRDLMAGMLEKWPRGLAAIENESTCCVRSLEELERCCSDFPTVAAVVDPCNHYLATATVGLAELTVGLVNRTVDVHVKDLTDSGYVPVGYGKLEWPRLIHRLLELNYCGFITLESHLRGDIEGVAMSLKALRDWVSP